MSATTDELQGQLSWSHDDFRASCRTCQRWWETGRGWTSLPSSCHHIQQMRVRARSPMLTFFNGLTRVYLSSTVLCRQGPGPISHMFHLVMERVRSLAYCRWKEVDVGPLSRAHTFAWQRSMRASHAHALRVGLPWHSPRGSVLLCCPREKWGLFFWVRGWLGSVAWGVKWGGYLSLSHTTTWQMRVVGPVHSLVTFQGQLAYTSHKQC